MMGKDIERMLTNVNDLGRIILNSINNKSNIDQTELDDTYNLLLEDYKKMQHVDELNFTDKSNFNNSIGSPWTEFENLMNILNNITDIQSMIPMIYTCIIDFKWALITYHDYVQRAFDNIYNDNVPSITFTNDSRGTQSTGNVSQKISNNVSVKDADITPY